MDYRNPQDINRDVLLRVVETGSSAEICAALVDAVHSIQDVEWLQKILIKLLVSPDIDVQGAAITCLGHLARLHGRIDVDSLIGPFQRIFANQPILRGRLDDVVDDLRVFLGIDISKRLLANL